VIEFDHVWHQYGERTVLEDITAKLTEQRIGIIGGNGSGKSTLARLINGLIGPSQGTVRIDGYDTVKERKHVRSKVGFVFQDPDQQIVMPTVSEDLEFSLRGSKLTKEDRGRRVERSLHQYGLESHHDHPAHLLSGGQKQLLAIMAILITEPEIVVFDEPTTLLDLKNAVAIEEIIYRLDQQVVVLTHDLEMLQNFDRVIVLDDGRVVADDVPNIAVKTYRGLVLS